MQIPPFICHSCSIHTSPHYAFQRSLMKWISLSILYSWQTWSRKRNWSFSKWGQSHTQTQALLIPSLVVFYSTMLLLMNWVPSLLRNQSTKFIRLNLTFKLLDSFGILIFLLNVINQNRKTKSKEITISVQDFYIWVPSEDHTGCLWWIFGNFLNILNMKLHVPCFMLPVYF